MADKHLVRKRHNSIAQKKGVHQYLSKIDPDALFRRRKDNYVPYLSGVIRLVKPAQDYIKSVYWSKYYYIP